MVIQTQAMVIQTEAMVIQTEVTINGYRLDFGEHNRYDNEGHNDVVGPRHFDYNQT